MDCTLLDVCAVSSAAARAGLRGYTAPPDCCTRLSAPPLAHDPARDGLPHPDRDHRLLVPPSGSRLAFDAKRRYSGQPFWLFCCFRTPPWHWHARHAALAGYLWALDFGPGPGTRTWGSVELVGVELALLAPARALGPRRHWTTPLAGRKPLTALRLLRNWPLALALALALGIGICFGLRDCPLEHASHHRQRGGRREGVRVWGRHGLSPGLLRKAADSLRCAGNTRRARG